MPRVAHPAPRLLAAAAALVAACGSVSGHAQGWKPERAVEIVVNTAPGSGPDRVARSVQRILTEHKIVAVPVNVNNKPGGGGAVAYGYVNRHPGDGHVLAIASASVLTNHIMGRSPVGHAEMTPLARLYGEYIAVAVKADSPIRSGSELIERLKKDPASIGVGVATSLGNSNHQAVALAMKNAGIEARKAKTAVFQSGGRAITALLGGHVEIVPASVSSWVKRLQAGEVRVLAVAAPKRLSGAFADVPTWKEQGVNVVVSNWRSVMGPKGLSDAQVAYWTDALRKVVATPEWKKDLERGLLSDDFEVGKAFKAELDAEYKELEALLVDLGLKK